ncbi:MAG: DUF3343 domain-containing protein [Clostridiales bacterium]|nr:DUF3343 domain-containing protein [Clostridiales bacterium]
MTMLAVFRSRAQTIDFVTYLRGAGVPVQTVSTPKEAGVGCGISARFDESFFPRVRFFLSKKSYSSFSGFMKNSGGRFAYL